MFEHVSPVCSLESDCMIFQNKSINCIKQSPLDGVFYPVLPDLIAGSVVDFLKTMKISSEAEEQSVTRLFKGTMVVLSPHSKKELDLVVQSEAFACGYKMKLLCKRSAGLANSSEFLLLLHFFPHNAFLFHL